MKRHLPIPARSEVPQLHTWLLIENISEQEDHNSNGDEGSPPGQQEHDDHGHNGSKESHPLAVIIEGGPPT